MAKIKLKKGIDRAQVAEQLRAIGCSLRQQLPDGSYVLHVSKPELFDQFLQQYNL